MASSSEAHPTYSSSPLPSSRHPLSPSSTDIDRILNEVPKSVDGENGSVFDPVTFLNQHFKSEAQLQAVLPELRTAVSMRIDKLDKSISTCINDAAMNAECSSQVSEDTAKELSRNVLRLKGKISAIQSKASASERAVQEITNEMQKLDLAKGHLQRTITTLKRLHMLTSATQRLKNALDVEDDDGAEIQFREAANLLDAIDLLLGHFEAYKGIAKVAEPRTEVENLKKKLVDRIERDFRRVGELVGEEDGTGETDGVDDNIGLPHLCESLTEACFALEALGQGACKRQLSAFCVDQLAPYGRSFGKKKSYVENIGGLDQIDRRFVWFRKLLTVIDQHFSKVFPNNWPIHYKLTNLFLIQTREHFLLHLKDPETGGSTEKNVSALVQALQKTRLFEKEMTARLKREYGVNFDTAANNQDDDDESMEYDELGNQFSRKSAKGIRARIAREKANVSEKVVLRGKVEIEKPQSIIGIASSVFDPYLEPYVSLEQQNMSQQIAKAGKDNSVASRGEHPVFTSSTDLFVYMKNSITRCTVLSRGETFFMLYQVFKKSLENYANVMFQKLPTSVSTAASFAFGASNIISSSVQYRIPDDEEQNICHVINTCEYCAENVEALQELITEQINDDYNDKIDLLPVQDTFLDHIAKSIQVLVSGLESRVEPSLKELVNISWGTVELVSEESEYVRTIHKIIESFVDVVRESIPPSYFTSFCDKFSRVFISSYNLALGRVKKISEPGTQQLLLDVYNLKTLIVKLPGPTKNATLSMYTKTVSQEFARIEIILKLVGTPTELLPDMFKSNWPNASLDDAQSVMDLKGMKKLEQQLVLEKMGFKVSASTAAVSAVGDNVRQFSEKVKQGFEAAQQAPATSPMNMKPASVNENLRQFNENTAAVAAKVNSDLTSMRLKMEKFTQSFGSKT